MELMQNVGHGYSRLMSLLVTGGVLIRQYLKLDWYFQYLAARTSHIRELVGALKGRHRFDIPELQPGFHLHQCPAFRYGWTPSSNEVRAQRGHWLGHHVHTLQ